ncbi:hypothetical protein [Campylobacter sp. MIT 97-5078]|uniref:hypothetical protein n=1 Tax=Campylobacter sp. MIT 97-5078 TaxID=1548153 RepID=UPI000512CA11|nr:hypothetical protein [Campylobacter sp. MIT 97-5078]KGI55275.1 hypothetical protein LR59_12730 [Campylobacter sp. MIT 97-5078]TQR23043.1 hypothetical protein DMB91_08485 [Campylobacter sp. MIT 97-5078]
MKKSIFVLALLGVFANLSAQSLDELFKDKEVKVSGELRLRYEKQNASDKSLLRDQKGSKATLNLSIE